MADFSRGTATGRPLGSISDHRAVVSTWYLTGATDLRSSSIWTDTTGWRITRMVPPFPRNAMSSTHVPDFKDRRSPKEGHQVDPSDRQAALQSSCVVVYPINVFTGVYALRILEPYQDAGSDIPS